MDGNDRSPPNRDNVLAEEKRWQLRRLTVRRRRERSDSDRRMVERRRPATSLMPVPSVPSFTLGLMA
jgi:hypothetical protein